MSEFFSGQGAKSTEKDSLIKASITPLSGVLQHLYGRFRLIAPYFTVENFPSKLTWCMTGSLSHQPCPSCTLILTNAFSSCSTPQPRLSVVWQSICLRHPPHVWQRRQASRLHSLQLHEGDFIKPAQPGWLSWWVSGCGKKPFFVCLLELNLKWRSNGLLCYNFFLRMCCSEIWWLSNHQFVEPCHLWL